MSPKQFLPTLLFLGIIAIALPNLVVGVNVASVVTPKFFNSILSQAVGCKGHSFYTRTGFLNAAKAFPKFGNGATVLASKREIAAFFAHVTHETGHFCYIEEISKPRYCMTTCPKYKCIAGKKYYGRGPLQITWNCNYGAAGAYLKLDLVRHPELVASSPTIAFKTALWYWQTRVRSRLPKGFAESIRAINGGECNGGNRAAVAARVKYYRQYCKAFGITPGGNLFC